MNSRKDKFEELAQELQSIEAELQTEAEKSRLGQSTLRAGKQVEIMLKQIAIMREQVEANSLPPVEERIRGMARIVIDSWPMDSTLGDKIVSLEQRYLKLS